MVLGIEKTIVLGHVHFFGCAFWVILVSNLALELLGLLARLASGHTFAQCRGLRKGAPLLQLDEAGFQVSLSGDLVRRRK